MSSPDDEIIGMHGPPIDLDDAEALLSGAAVPPGLEDLAGLLVAARPAPARAGADPLERVAVTALTRPGALSTSKRRPGRRRVLVAKVLTAKAVAAVVVALLGGVAAAAAAGVLPGPVQSTLSRGLHRVGVSIPGAPRTPGASLTSRRDDAGVTSSSGGTHSGTAPGAGIAGRAGLGTTDGASRVGAGARSRAEVSGLCRAYRADTSAIAAGATPTFLVRLDALAGAPGPTRYCAKVLAVVPSQQRAKESPHEARTSTGTADHSAGTAGERRSHPAGSGHAAGSAGSGHAAGSAGSAGSGNTTGTPGGSRTPVSGGGSARVGRRPLPHRRSAADDTLRVRSGRALRRRSASGAARQVHPPTR